MGRLAAAGVAVVLCFGLGLGACAAVVTSAVGGTSATGATGITGLTAPGGVATEPVALVGPGGASGPGGPAVPPGWVTIEQAASRTCPGLEWSVLGAIGRMESNSGRSTLPGVASGSNAYGAQGPMQFEPATFAAYAVVGPGGATPPSPYDPVDAVYSAARMLCENGGGNSAHLYGALWDYDHTRVYVETVLVLSYALAVDPVLGTRPATAVAFAAGKLGVPYVWGGTGPDGYDCSGLVQAAYRAADVALPRVAQTQYDAGPHVPPAAALVPGDLVFFGESASDVLHVGMYLGAGEMIDAPHTGTVVRIEPTPTTAGDHWGADIVVGETRPWA